MSQTLAIQTLAAPLAAPARAAMLILAALVGTLTGLGLVSVITSTPGPRHAMIAAIVAATYAMGGAVLGAILTNRQA